MDRRYATHVLMRFSDKLHDVDDMIAEHNKVIKRYGAVWFGKLGKPLAQTHIDRIHRQRDNGVPSYLYLVQKGGTGYIGGRGDILEITRVYPGNEKKLIPPYYFDRGFLEHVRVWVKLSRLLVLEKGELAKLRVAASGMPVPITLHESIAGMFLVREG